MKQGVKNEMYDGSFVLCGDSLTGNPVTGTGGAEFHSSLLDAGGLIPTWPGHYLPNPRPSDEACSVDGELDIHLGYKRVNGCPGVLKEIRGEWAHSFYVDGADREYLLQYIAGLGPAPLGAWRFEF